MTVDDLEVGMRVIYNSVPFDTQIDSGYNEFDGKEGVVEAIRTNTIYGVSVKFTHEGPYLCHVKELTPVYGQIDDEDLWE